MREDRERFINRTREFWQPRTSRLLDRVDCRQIFENLIGFFQILSEWVAAEHSRPTFPSENTETPQRKGR